MLAHNVTALIDAKGVKYVENVYDPNDRVSSQRFGGSVGFFEYGTGSLPDGA